LSILHLRAAEQPYAVLDVETTGLSADVDRVIEIAVAHLDPGRPPRLVLDTLINPGQPVWASEVHGITDADVSEAPTFSEIAAELTDALVGRVVVGHNVYFDERFIREELARVGVSFEHPILCTSGLRSVLGIGKRCRLEDACIEAGIRLDNGHEAGADTLACAHLLRHYFSELTTETFADLAGKRTLKFLKSFTRALPIRQNLPRGETPLRSRAAHWNRSRVKQTSTSIRFPDTQG